MIEIHEAMRLLIVVEQTPEVLSAIYARQPEAVTRVVAALQEAGVKRWVNGAFTFTPDGNPLVGPVPGLRNYWAACGCMAGFRPPCCGRWRRSA